MGIKYQFNNPGNGLGDRVLSTTIPRDIKNAYVCLDCGYEFVALKSAKCRRCESKIKEANKLLDKSDQIKYKPNVKNKFDWQIRMNTNFPLVWHNNPWVDDFGVEDLTKGIGPGMGTQMSNSSGLHATNNYRISVESALNITIPQGPPYGDLHLSEEEKNAPPEIDRRYWLITSGGKEDYTSKIWPYDRWQAVVDALPEITFVQIGLNCHFHPPLEGKNVINMVGQTEDHDSGVRRLFKLFLHCDGSMGLLSAHMHIAGASPFFKPCVVVAGAREPAYFEQYNFHRYLNTNGWFVCPKDLNDDRTRAFSAMERVCWRRSVEACPNKVKYNYAGYEYFVARCLDVITVEDVVKGIKGYYEGGRLEPIEAVDGKKSIVVPDARLADLQEIVEDIVEGTEQDNKIYEQLIAKGLRDLSEDAPAEAKLPQSPNAIFIKPVKEDSEELLLQATVEHNIAARLSPKEERTIIIPKQPKVFKMLCNAHYWGGGERSSAFLMKLMLDEGYEVHLYPAKYHEGQFVVGYEYGLFLEEHPEIRVYKGTSSDGKMKVTDPCDVFCIYANDLVYGFDKPQFSSLMRLQARRKVMILNYKIGKVPEVVWTRQWDKYGFLNNTLRSAFIRRYPEARAFALAPPVDNEAFLDTQLDPFQEPLHIVKLSSQGDNKHPEETNDMIRQIRQFHPNAKFSFMPAPSFLNTNLDGVFAYKKNEIPVIDFLVKGNLFWYPLPDGYTDQGPRVLVEAMSLGLPAIADNRDGAAERIKPGITGWLCNSHDEYAEVLKDITIEQLYKMGKAAKETAERWWKPENWVAQLVGDTTD